MSKYSIVHKNLFILALTGLFITGCKKTTTEIQTNTSDSGTQSVIATDEINVNDLIEQAVDEAVAALSISNTTSGGPTNNVSLFLSPGVLVDTSQISSGTLFVNYFVGKTQDSAVGRSGNVKIQLPVIAGHIVPWKNPGTTATITFTNSSPTQDYEAFYYRPVPNTTLWFKGSVTVTNFNGGLLNNLAVGDSLVEKLRGQISYTNNDNNVVLTLWTWNLNDTRIVEKTNTNHITIATRADTNVNGFNNVTTWGQTRTSQNFYTSVTTPVFRDISSAAKYNPLSGIKLINGISEPVTITLGVDAAGNPVVNTIPFGFRINWTFSGTPESFVISY